MDKKVLIAIFVVIVILVGFSTGLLVIINHAKSDHEIIPTPIIITPTPTIVNASTPTPTITSTPTPVLTNGSNSTKDIPDYDGKNFDEYITWVTSYYYNTSAYWIPNQSHVDPLSPDGYAFLIKYQADHPQSNVNPLGQNSSSNPGIYQYQAPSPTPTPLPTHVPLKDVHLPLRQYPPYNEFLPQDQYDSVNGNESLFWNYYSSQGIYGYYHNDEGYCDAPVINITFLSRYLDGIVNPIIDITLEQSYTDANGIEWANMLPDGPFEFVYPVTIPSPGWNYDHTEFIYSSCTIEKPIPQSVLKWLNHGTFRMHIQIYLNENGQKGVRLGDVWRQFTMF